MTSPDLPDETQSMLVGMPPRILEGLRRYAIHHQEVGSFLRAVLENNLTEAVCRADPESLAALRIIVIYVYNCLPASCHGSPEAVKAWLKKGETQ